MTILLLTGCLLSAAAAGPVDPSEPAARVTRVSADRGFAVAAVPTDTRAAVPGARAVLIRGGLPVGLGRVTVADAATAGIELEWADPGLAADGTQAVFFRPGADGRVPIDGVFPPAGAVIAGVEPDGRLRLTGRRPAGRPLWVYRGGRPIARLTSADNEGRALPAPGTATAAPAVGDAVLPVGSAEVPPGAVWGRVLAVRPDGGESRVTVDLGEADGVRPGTRLELFRRGFVATAHVDEAGPYTSAATVFAVQARVAPEAGDVVKVLSAADGARVFRVQGRYFLFAAGEPAGIREGAVFRVLPADDVPGTRSAPSGEILRVRADAVKVSYSGAAPAPDAPRSAGAARLWDRVVPAEAPAEPGCAEFPVGSAFCRGRLVRLNVGRGAGLGAGVTLVTAGPEAPATFSVIWADDGSALAWAADPARGVPVGAKLRFRRPACISP